MLPPEGAGANQGRCKGWARSLCAGEREHKLGTSTGKRRAGGCASSVHNTGRTKNGDCRKPIYPLESVRDHLSTQHTQSLCCSAAVSCHSLPVSFPSPKSLFSATPLPRQLLAVATALSTVLYFVGHHPFFCVVFLFSEPELTAVSRTPLLAAATPDFTAYPAANMFWWTALPCESTSLSACADFPTSSGLNSPHPSHIAFVACTPLTRCPSMFTTRVPVSLSSALSLSPALHADQFYALQQLFFFACTPLPRCSGDEGRQATNRTLRWRAALRRLARTHRLAPRAAPCSLRVQHHACHKASAPGAPAPAEGRAS